MSEEVRSGISKRYGVYGLCGEGSRGIELSSLFFGHDEERLSEGEESLKKSRKADLIEVSYQDERCLLLNLSQNRYQRGRVCGCD